MKTLILNYKKWRCGMDGVEGTSHGKGNTNLLNKEGYMCCLGQFASQLNPNIKRKHVFNNSCLYNTCKIIPLLSKKTNGMIEDTELSCSAMGINDDMTTQIEQKIKKLKSLFRKRGYIIKVTHLPKTLAKKVRK